MMEGGRAKLTPRTAGEFSSLSTLQIPTGCAICAMKGMYLCSLCIRTEVQEAFGLSAHRQSRKHELMSS